MSKPLSCSSLIAALSCETEAETLGSLTMLASGVLARAPSSARASSARPNCARIRAATEMSRVSTLTPALAAYASTIGRKEYVASSGASSVWV
jgi:hypothetical protein